MSLIDQLHCVFGTVVDRELRPLALFFAHGAVADHLAVAHVVGVEEFRCQRHAPAVALAAIGIDGHSHGCSFPQIPSVSVIETSELLEAIRHGSALPTQWFTDPAIFSAELE